MNISTVDVRLPEGMSEAITPYPPTPFQSLIFYCRNAVAMGQVDQLTFIKQPLAVLLGPQFSRVNVKVFDQLSAVRVDFLPGGVFRMLGIPMLELFDQGFDASYFFGPEIKSITEQLQQLDDLETCKQIVEHFLLKQAAKLRFHLPFDAAMYSLLQNEGRLSVDTIASLSCLSTRQFERKCQERIGMNPKMYTRILKFSRAYTLHEAFPNLSWTHIAFEAGYYDQMHMIRDFRLFAGVNPSVISAQLLDTPIRMQKQLSL